MKIYINYFILIRHTHSNTWEWRHYYITTKIWAQWETSLDNYQGLQFWSLHTDRLLTRKSCCTCVYVTFYGQEITKYTTVLNWAHIHTLLLHWQVSVNHPFLPWHVGFQGWNSANSLHGIQHNMYLLCACYMCEHLQCNLTCAPYTCACGLVSPCVGSTATHFIILSKVPEYEPWKRTHGCLARAGQNRARAQNCILR